jgi:Site-specific recombinase XerD
MPPPRSARSPASWTDVDAPLVTAFLEHLEVDRRNSPRTRNNRLAAIHSLFAYAALRHPEHAASIRRVLAIPPKRHENRLLTYLSDEEVEALLAACDRATWTGRRDHAMLTLAVQTGLRVSELAALTCADMVLGVGANVHTRGKGRKQRRTPLVAPTVEVLRSWLTESQAAGTTRYSRPVPAGPSAVTPSSIVSPYTSDAPHGVARRCATST